jgi:hypothetical protein
MIDGLLLTTLLAGTIGVPAPSAQAPTAAESIGAAAYKTIARATATSS